MSELPTVIQALAEVKRKVGAVAKRSWNQQQGFNFRGVDAVVNAVGPQLDKVGVVHVPLLEASSYDTVEVGKNRTLMGHAQVEVTYRFYGPAGDYVDARVPGEALDSGDKAMTKAMSIAWRTALIQVLNLRTGDPEPDERSYERSPRRTVEDIRAEALNLNATKEDLRRLYREVSRAGMIPQATVDEAGNQTRLGDLIVRRSREAPEGLPRNKDGSVARSKLTDEQRAAAGIPSKAQVREHSKLVKATLADEKKAERSDSAELSDPWQTKPTPRADYVCELCGTVGKHFEDECDQTGGAT